MSCVSPRLSLALILSKSLTVSSGYNLSPQRWHTRASTSTVAVSVPPLRSLVTRFSANSPPHTGQAANASLNLFSRATLASPALPVRLPPLRVGSVDGYDDREATLLIVRPDAVNRVASEAVPVHQATRIGPVRRVLFYYFSVDHREVDLIERQHVGLGLFVGVIGDQDLALTDRPDEILDTYHPRLRRKQGACFTSSLLADS